VKDKMTPIERFAALNAGGEIDRLPCVPIVGNTAARVVGVKVSDLRYSGETIAKAHIAAYLLFGYDNIRIFTDLYVLAEAMGAKVYYPDDETAYLDSPAIEDESEIHVISPANPVKDGRLPAFLDAIKMTLDAAGKEVPVTAALTCPFTNASFLIGAEKAARLTRQNPEALHRLCEVSLRSAINYAKAVIDAGAAPSLTDPMSSCTVVSRRVFETFAYPYLKRLIDYIHGRGKAVTLHICGKTGKIWDLMADAGADCISIDDEVSLEEAKNAVGTRVRLMGNVRPSDVMLLGSREDVKRATTACVRAAHDSPKGLIVASGCSLPTETPFENIHQMMDTVREIGYPVTI